MTEVDHPIHRPVLSQEIVHLLGPRPNGVVVDGTVGLGGHAEALLQAESGVTVIGIDRDKEALSHATRRLAPFKERVRLIHGNYRDLGEHLDVLGIDKITGFLLDLGLSSLQLDRPERGFSFRHDGPLDMRMDTTQSVTAAELVNHSSEEDLVRILRDYGEERFARRIVRAILAARAKESIETTGRLTEIVHNAIPRKFHPKAIHPATRTFQALRIAVNEELANLKEGLEAGFQAIAPGGVIAVISFHSLEDRIVKGFFRYKALSCTCPPDFPICVCDKKVEVEILTRKPIRSSPEEVAKNPRARSAKLRAARKLDIRT